MPLFQTPFGYATITGEKVKGFPDLLVGLAPTRKGEPGSVEEQAWHPNQIQDWVEIDLFQLPDEWCEALDVVKPVEEPQRVVLDISWGEFEDPTFLFLARLLGWCLVLCLVLSWINRWLEG